MGLNTTHECWDGPYSSFTRWRLALIKSANIPTEISNGIEYAKIDWNSIVPRNYLGIWSVAPKDPLYILIYHSDCEGYILPEDQLQLAERLEQLIPFIKDKEGINHDYLIEKTLKFIAGLRKANYNNEIVEFH